MEHAIPIQYIYLVVHLMYGVSLLLEMLFYRAAQLYAIRECQDYADVIETRLYLLAQPIKAILAALVKLAQFCTLHFDCQRLSDTLDGDVEKGFHMCIKVLKIKVCHCNSAVITPEKSINY